MSTYSDLKLILDDECDSNDTSYPVATKLRNINSALEEIVGEIIECNGDFQFDDSNFTDLPEGTATLVNGQQNYSYDVTFLDIVGVSVMDAQGKYQKLIPIDQREMGADPSQFQSTNGMPVYYDKKGGSVYLYPAPATGSVTMTEGLKVFFQRTAHLFELADTTAVPGFISTYHRILPLMASLPYNRKYHPDRVNSTLVEIQELRTKLLSRYSKRSKDERPRLGIRQESCR
jgi:hypothetical protein